MTTPLPPDPVPDAVPDPVTGAVTRSRHPARAVVAGSAVLAVSAGLVMVVPRLLHTTWPAVWSVLGGVPVGWLIVLAVVWLAGLVAHTLVLSASLPGLSARRALALNLAGSSVANLVPLGGPVSLGLTTGMARSWGFRSTAIGAFLTVSSVWNVAARAGLGVVGLIWWMTRPGAAHPALVGGAAALVVAVVAAAVAVLSSERVAAGLAGLAGRLAAVAARVAAFLRTGGRPGRRAAGRSGGQRPARVRTPGVEAGVRDRVTGSITSVRSSSVAIARRSWPALSAGMLGYSVLLFLLLDLCLRVLGAPQPVMTVVAVVCVERLLTAVPLTPGAVGVAEIGLAGSLVLGGVDPATAAAAALLYRLYTFALEIPVGLLVATGWAVARRRLPVLTARPVGGGS